MNALLLERRLSPSLLVRRWHQKAKTPLYPANAHAAFELACVFEGRCRYRIGGRSFDVTSGRAMFVPPNVVHQTGIDPGTRAGSFWVAPELMAELAEVAGGHAPEASVLEAPAAADTILQAADHGADPLLVDAALEGLLLRLLRGAPARTGPRDPRIRRALDYIEAHHDEPLTIEGIAAVARMSRYHFSRTFRAEIGLSPYQHLQKIRVERAAALLSRGDHNVTEAALAVGFPDLGRFGRTFKSVLGTTPSEFRQQQSH